MTDVKVIKVRRTPGTTLPSFVPWGEPVWTEGNQTLWIGKSDNSGGAIAVAGSSQSTPSQAGILKIASESIQKGSLVNFWLDSGVESVRKASAANKYSCHGYASAAANVGESILIITQHGTVNSFPIIESGSIMDGICFLSETLSGAFSLSSVNTIGHIYQKVGFISDSKMIFSPGIVITRG